jgi:hypothetical protein
MLVGLKWAYVRILLLHLYIVGTIWLFPLLLTAFNGKSSDLALIENGRRIFGLIALLAYLFFFVYGLVLAQRIHPIWSRRRIPSFGRVRWLLVYPILGILVLSLLARVQAPESILNFASFMFLLSIIFPAIMTTAFTICTILNAFLISTHRRNIPIYQRL